MTPTLRAPRSVGAAIGLALTAGIAAAQPPGPAPSGPITLDPSTTPAPGWTNNSGQQQPQNETGPPLLLPSGTGPSPGQPAGAGANQYCQGGMDTSHQVPDSEGDAREDQSFVRYPNGTIVYGDGRVNRAPGDCATYPTPR